jgi:hypothetical protein
VVTSQVQLLTSLQVAALTYTQVETMGAELSTTQIPYLSVV